MTSCLVAVAVPIPGLGVLSYRVPNRVEPPPKGARVAVPLGARTVTGCVVGPSTAELPAAAMRDVIAVLDDEPFLPPAIVDLALWVGEYYASGPGDALAVAMPPSARRGRASAFRLVTVAELHPEWDRTQSLKGPRQREAAALLGASRSGMALAELARLGVSHAVVRSLETQGIVRLRQDVLERDPLSSDGADGSPWSLEAAMLPDRPLTDEQASALTRLQTLLTSGHFHTVLLHGVTGSGKTELYLRLAADAVAVGRRALVLVPEIALTPALVGQVSARFGSRVAVQHSALSEGERHDQWHRVRRGDVDVVVGTRSAVFAPIDRLGLIVVDEEHESSYKQEESPRYHGRDVAVMRGRMERALVVLGSATPSLESATNASRGRYELVTLRKRVLDRPLAAVRIVDMRTEMAAHGAAVTLSGALLDALEERLARGEQSLVLLNRRGFATVIFCRQCGRSTECPHCSVNLTYHRGAKHVRCHYCNYQTAVPKHCSECGGEYLEQSGFGTERLEADLRDRFASARVVRIDRDTVRRRGTVGRVLAAVARREIDILVGTQMIAKGHDFPAVTLVGVVSADVGLGLPDFRAGERTFQLLTQVVGRAGRGTTPGEAIVQTLYPDHYSIRAAAGQDYDAFAARELAFRRALQYPPATSLINVVVRGRTMARAMSGAQDLARRVRETSGARVLGPAPAALSKIKDEYRAQFFIKGARRRGTRDALEAALDARPDLKRRIIVDVDPVSVI